MESLNKVFTEEQVNEVSTKILKASIAKITDELQGKFNQELEIFIYEHYLNSKSQIEGNLIAEIVEEFIKNPMQFKFVKLREKLFLENKEFLITTLTDESIMINVENVIKNYTHKDHYFNWQWKDGIIRIIGENWHRFKDDERVNNGLLRQIENLKSQVNNLQQKLNDVENVISE